VLNNKQNNKALLMSRYMTVFLLFYILTWSATNKKVKPVVKRKQIPGLLSLLRQNS